MQPTPYTPVTNFADDERSNAGGRSTVRTDRVDAELDAISTSVNETIANLALIQRDDGKLIDGLVEYYNLSAAARASLMATKWIARGLWLTATAYVPNDMVDVAGVSYICPEGQGHTSGVFLTDYAAGKWQIFVTSSSAGGQSFAPTVTILSLNTQAAVEEVDTKLRAASLPLLSCLYGGF